MRRDVRAKVDTGYLLEAMRRACLAIVGAMLDIIVMKLSGGGVGDITYDSIELNFAI